VLRFVPTFNILIGHVCLVVGVFRDGGAATKAKALVYVLEHFRGFENPLPRTKEAAEKVVVWAEKRTSGAREPA
jgi:hypothetical protein